MTTTSNKKPSTEPPAWHKRLVTQLRAIDRDPGLAAACRRGRNREPLDELDMHQPISYVLEGNENTPLAEYVPSWQRDEVIAAVHHTLALYACHAQSKSTSVHRDGISLGAAIRRLQNAMPSKDGASRRFRAAQGADSTTELTSHVRFLVSLMRTYNVTLDYVALADALAAWHSPARRQGLKRIWGMDFHRTPHKPTDATTEPIKE
ncbi:type I-E CRISPR-associated protein Cse2/CasB [Streptomyces sp. ISL-99]|uniref:type I-E CRISPR-associated protein Cse2/CasB n=1 Tax=Streptomyces sp. ISL-99 TaxID=2819193 RepID=UPI001BE9A321|nr:type I-E CRISPR-associated protein Cse2/CasB [Streptomyces sp. ISL-99]MBT2529403.1 type I-E CRISPR-associated protein Cse2/CasB [Streptomyces sp. ISL-99]